VKLSILIPVYNERRLLPELLLKVSSAMTGLDKEVILVDDGSTDGTREWIREMLAGANGPVEPYGALGLKVVFHERNQGKGAAIRTAIRAASGWSAASGSGPADDAKPIPVDMDNVDRVLAGVAPAFELTEGGPTVAFATLDSAYIPLTPRAQRLFKVHLTATIVLALFVIGLWVYFR